MSDAGELLEKLRSVSVESAVQHLRVIHELKQKAANTPARGKGWLRSDSSEVEGGEETQSSLPEQLRRGSDLVFDCARLGLRNYEQWLKLNARQFDYVMDALNALTRPRGGPPPKLSRLRLRVSGRRGEQAAARFVIDNPLPVVVAISFSTPTLKRVADGKRFKAKVEFERAGTSSAERCDFDVAAGDCGRFQALIAVDPEIEAGAYAVESQVLAASRVVGRIHIELDVQ